MVQVSFIGAYSGRRMSLLKKYNAGKVIFGGMSMMFKVVDNVYG